MSQSTVPLRPEPVKVRVTRESPIQQEARALALTGALLAATHLADAPGFDDLVNPIVAVRMDVERRRWAFAERVA